MGLLKTKRDGQVVAFRLDREAIILGSGRDCTIRVPDAVPRHCQIVKMANGFVLRDLSGVTGTFVNGKKIKEHLLGDKDVIQLGTERFTFANEAGENTARVTVPTSSPIARPATAKMPAAPARPTTARVPAAVAPPPVERKTTTRAIPAQAPPATARVATARVPAVAPAAPAKSPTGRVPAAQPNNGRATQGIRPATQRLGGITTRRMPSRTTGRIKKTGGFSLPSTRKGKIIAVCVALGVAGAIGLFGVLYMNREDPEKIKADFANEMKTFRVLAKDRDKVLEADKQAEDLLGNTLYKKYELTLYKEVERAHKALHDAAGEQRQAENEVRPFFQKYEAAKKQDVKKMREAAPALYDEVKSLCDKYAPTKYGADLVKIKDDLTKNYLTEKTDKWEVDLPSSLRPRVRSLSKEGKFKSALEAVNEFGKKFEEEKTPDLFKQLQEDRDSLKRQAKAYVDKLGKQVPPLVADGKKADAMKLLEEEKAELDGEMFKDALKDLEERITKLKSEK